MNKLPLLAFLLSSQLAFAGHPKLPAATCNTVFKAIDVPSYLLAVSKQELGPETLTAAEAKLDDYFRTLPCATVGRLFPSFSGIVSALIKGMEEVAAVSSEAFVKEVAKNGWPSVSEAALLQVAKKAARDPLIYKSFVMAEFIVRGMYSVDYYFALLQFPHILRSHLPFRIETYPEPIRAGPRQAEMVRVALQYTITSPADHILELGYGSPAVLMGLMYYTQTQRLTGVDLSPVLPGAAEFLQPLGIELLQGKFPDDAQTRVQLQEKGPYSVILALDAIKRDRRILQTSTPPRDFVKHLYDLLAPQGTVVIVNDYDGEPYFTQKQAQDAGFESVIWGQRRVLPKEIRAFLPYERKTAHGGTLAVHVLRKGSLRKDHIWMNSSPY